MSPHHHQTYIVQGGRCNMNLLCVEFARAKYLCQMKQRWGEGGMESNPPPLVLGTEKSSGPERDIEELNKII